MKYRNIAQVDEIIKSDYKKKIIFSDKDFRKSGYLLQVVTIPPHTKQRKHSHKKQTEVFFILEGETNISINGTDYLAKLGDSFICSPGDTHNLWNKTDKEFKLVVFKFDVPENNEDTNWEVK